MIENEFQTEDSLDFISLEIFQKISDMVFGISDIKEIENFDINKIDKDKIALLFSWPLLIAKRYLCPYMELDLFKKQCKFNQILSNDFNPDEIWSYLSDFNIDKYFFLENSEKLGNLILENEEIDQNFQDFTQLFTNLFEKNEDKFSLKKILNLIDKEPKHKLIDLVLGGKPDSKSNPLFPTSKLMKRTFFANLIDRIIDCEATGLKLRNGIFYYYLILFFILNNIENKANASVIDFNDIFVSSIECPQIFSDQTDVILSNSFELLVTFGSSLFSDTINFFINDYKDIFLKKGFPENSNFEEHQFYKSKPEYMASISRTDDDAEGNGCNYRIDVDREIKMFQELDYKLAFWFRKDLSNNEFIELITFEGDENKDQLKQLFHCLSALAHRLSIHISDYSNKYSHFISNADIFVDQDLTKFLDNMDEIQSSYYLFNEYLDHKDFSRAIETLDMKLAYDCIEETRADLKKKKKTHLSPKLIQDLLVANNEIILLFSKVQGQRADSANRNKLANEFFRDNPHYFKVLKTKDIKGIDFSYDPNGIRNTRRKIFHDIAEKAGKEIAGYKIAKKLAVE